MKLLQPRHIWIGVALFSVLMALSALAYFRSGPVDDRLVGATFAGDARAH